MTAKVLSNLESVGDLVGALNGIGDGIEEDAYMEGLIKSAHGKAANAFDIAAMATAAAGRITHVYEFGVNGITPGNPVYPDPTAREARLYVHTLTGHGGQQDIGYTFRPALQRNPQPTTARTGVKSKYLAKLSKRKYIFWNKAFVTETGMTVSIKPEHGNYLFIPFGGEGARNPLNKKNFVMWNARKGPIQSTPGKGNRGEFTTLWMTWWAAEGSKMFEHDMTTNVTMDIERAMAAASKKANTESMKPAQAINVPGAASRARAWARGLFKKNDRVKVETR